MAAGDSIQGMVSAARANCIPYVEMQTVDALCARPEGGKGDSELLQKKSATVISMQEKGASAVLCADVEREVQSALAALQSAGNSSDMHERNRQANSIQNTQRAFQERNSEGVLPAGSAPQAFGAEVLYALASSGNEDRRDKLMQQQAFTIVCERVASGKLQVGLSFALSISSRNRLLGDVCNCQTPQEPICLIV